MGPQTLSHDATEIASGAFAAVSTNQVRSRYIFARRPVPGRSW